LGLGFLEPYTAKFDLAARMAFMKEKLGYEYFSYWEFFENEDADKVIEQNV
jgi:hypothetical protein